MGNSQTLARSQFEIFSWRPLSQLIIVNTEQVCWYMYVLIYKPFWYFPYFRVLSQKRNPKQLILFMDLLHPFQKVVVLSLLHSVVALFFYLNYIFSLRCTCDWRNYIHEHVHAILLNEYRRLKRAIQSKFHSKECAIRKLTFTYIIIRMQDTKCLVWVYNFYKYCCMSLTV